MTTKKTPKPPAKKAKPKGNEAVKAQITAEPPPKEEPFVFTPIVSPEAAASLPQEAPAQAPELAPTPQTSPDVVRAR